MAQLAWSAVPVPIAAAIAVPFPHDSSAVGLRWTAGAEPASYCAQHAHAAYVARMLLVCSECGKSNCDSVHSSTWWWAPEIPKKALNI